MQEIIKETSQLALTNKCSLSGRTITSLQLDAPTNFTPYNELEFDSAVINYCQNKCNHIIQTRNHKEHNLNLAKPFNVGGSNKLKPPPAYDSVNTPFNRVIRSCKVVVSGDVAVGKTSLISRFGEGAFSSSHRTTIGVDFDLQRFSVLGQPYVLQIWDTAGLEMFRCVTNAYYRGCQVAILVFDMANMGSLANVVKWKDDVLEAAKTFDQLDADYHSDRHCKTTTTTTQDGSDDSGPLLFLVGTKSDLAQTEASRAFMWEQANRIAANLRAELWFVSAQTGENVDGLFNRIAALSFNRCILKEIQRIKFETSTMGVCLKEKMLKQRRESWIHANKVIKITKKKDGDERRTRCINIQCVIK